MTRSGRSESVIRNPGTPFHSSLHHSIPHSDLVQHINHLPQPAVILAVEVEGNARQVHLVTAVALLGRNTSIGVLLGALLFGSLLFGTTHGLTSNVIQPELAGNLTYIIQGLVVLFVGADILILYVWNTRKRMRRRARPAEAAA